MDENQNQLNDLQQQVDDHEDALTKLKSDLANLSNNYYQNNFSSSQDFTKYSRFTGRLRIPNNATLPSTCNVGDLSETGGKLYICSTLNTWVVAGSQS